MVVEDLAALDNINDESVLDELEERLKLKLFHSFVGDILLILNPYEHVGTYGDKVSEILLTLTLSFVTSYLLLF